LESFLNSPDVFYSPGAYVGKRSLAEEFAQFCSGSDMWEQWEDVRNPNPDPNPLTMSPKMI
jgi:hypothetical protein